MGGFHQRSLVLGPVVATAMALGACQAGVPEAGNGLTMLRYETLDGPAGGFLTGTIDYRDGCIWIDHAGGSSIVIWPPDAKLTSVQGRTVVQVGGPAGVTLGDGSSASLAGREYSDALTPLRELVGDVVDTCITDSYWMVTEAGLMIVN